MGSMENGHSTERRFGTLAVHAGAPHDPVTGAVIAPVCLRLRPYSSGTAANHRTDLPVYHLRPDQCRQPRWSVRVHSQLQP